METATSFFHLTGSILLNLVIIIVLIFGFICYKKCNQLYAWAVYTTNLLKEYKTIIEACCQPGEMGVPKDPGDFG